MTNQIIDEEKISCADILPGLEDFEVTPELFESDLEVISPLEQEFVDEHKGEIEELFSIYLREVGGNPLLNYEEEVELGRRMKKGREARAMVLEAAENDQELPDNTRKALIQAINEGKEAEDTMVLHNTRLVISIAKRYQNRGVEFQDLVQEGNLGLIRAKDKYDYTKGWRFSTYATWWIRQAVTRFVANGCRMVRLPVHVGERIAKLMYVQSKLSRNGNSTPSIEDISREMGMSPQKVTDVLEAMSMFTVSIDSQKESIDGDDGEYALIDRLSGEPDEVESQVDNKLLSDALLKIMNSLEPLEQRIVRLRFGYEDGIPHSLDEISSILNQETGLTRSRESIRKVEFKALRHFRIPGVARMFSDYL